MIDTNNQSLGFPARPIDNVSGYTLQQLEQSIIGVQTWTQWRNSIAQDHTNATEGNLPQLFNNWQD